MDWIVKERGDVKEAAEALGVSTSQMIKFLAKEPAALELVNQLRAAPEGVRRKALRSGSPGSSQRGVEFRLLDGVML